MVELGTDLRRKVFLGVVEPNDDVRFKITEEDFYYDDLPGIIELLNPGVELQIGGFVVRQLRRRALRGPSPATFG